MTAYAGSRSSGGSPLGLLLFLGIIFALGFVAVAMVPQMLNSAQTATISWELEGLTQSTYLATSQTSWQSLPSGMLGNLPNPQDFCNQISPEIQKLAGPCEWEESYSIREDGTTSYRLRLRAGQQTVAEGETSEFFVQEFSEVANAVANNPAFSAYDTFWIESVKVASWVRRLGLGASFWKVLMEWSGNGQNLLRVTADASGIGWVPKLLTQAQTSGLIGPFIEVLDQMWIFIQYGG